MPSCAGRCLPGESDFPVRRAARRAQAVNRRWLLVFSAAFALGAVASFWLWPRRLPVKSPAQVSVLPGQPAPALPALERLATPRRPPLADALGAPTTKPEQEAQVVLDLLAAYRRVVGEFPVGEDNRQIVRALLGANAKRLPVLPRDHPRLNAAGELVDAWGRPFFFHLLSREQVEVRSAGPDREFYTTDDLVAGRRPEPDRPELQRPRS